MINLKFFVPALCASAMTIAPATVSANDPGGDDQWQFKASVYLWGAGIDAETTAGSEVDISFDELINNLNMHTSRCEHAADRFQRESSPRQNRALGRA